MLKILSTISYLLCATLLVADISIHDSELKNQEFCQDNGDSRSCVYNSDDDITIEGDSLCSTIIAKTISMQAQNVENGCLIFAFNQVIINATEEFINKGTIISGGDIIINGQPVAHHGLYKSGFYQSNLFDIIFHLLSIKKYHNIEEIIPKAYLGSSGQHIYSLDKKTTQAVYLAMLNATDELSQTLLMYFAAEGDIQTVQWLLKQGVKISTRNDSNLNAIDIARQENQDETAELIQAWGEAHPEALEKFTYPSNL